MGIAVEPDFVLEEIERVIRDEGLSAWGASGRIFDSGVSPRTRSTLYYHARKIFALVASETDPEVRAAVQRLLAGEDVLVKKALARDVALVLKRYGHEWYQHPRAAVLFRLKCD